MRFEQSLSLLDSLALNRLLIADSTSTAMTSASTGLNQTLDSFWNEDYRGFRTAADSISTIAQMGIGIGVGGAFGIAVHGGDIFSKASYQRILARTTQALTGTGFREMESVKVGGAIWGKLANKDETYRKLAVFDYDHMFKNQKTITGLDLKGIDHEKGIWLKSSNVKDRRGIFVKKSKIMSPMGSIALGVGAWAAGSLLGSGISLAGGLLDEAHMAYAQSKMHTYDVREFNNRSMQEWNFNKRTQMQGNFIPFEQNNLSLARMYYSR